MIWSADSVFSDETDKNDSTFSLYHEEQNLFAHPETEVEVHIDF